MSERHRNRRGVGRLCFSCGLCFARGTHQYAVYECLPEKWAYEFVTFLICSTCGTAHAIEYSMQDGTPSRLRARRGPLRIPLSPEMRRNYSRFVKEHNVATRPHRSRDYRYPPRHINLLPPTPWKRKAGDLYRKYSDAILEGFVHVVACILLVPLLPLITIEYIQDVLWERNHPPEPWQQRDPIWVTSPETLEQRVRQLRDLHHNYETLWPVVLEELSRERAGARMTPSGEWNLYADLACSRCGTPGSLTMDLRNPEAPEYSIFPLPQCPCYQQNSVLGDEGCNTETSLYLMGDILFFHESFNRLDWIRTFRSEDGSPSPTAVFRLENGGAKPYRITNPGQTRALRLEVPPGHTYEVHIKQIPDESPRDNDSSVPLWGNYEVVAVREGERVIYRASGDNP